MEICETCKYWVCELGKLPDEMGECRRYAPKPELSDNEEYEGPAFVNWPVTHLMCWCGEYEEDESRTRFDVGKI